MNCCPKCGEKYNSGGQLTHRCHLSLAKDQIENISVNNSSGLNKIAAPQVRVSGEAYNESGDESQGLQKPREIVPQLERERAIEACVEIRGNKAYDGSYAAPREAYRKILQKEYARGREEGQFFLGTFRGESAYGNKAAKEAMQWQEIEIIRLKANRDISRV